MPRNVVITVHIVKMVSTVVKIVVKIVAMIVAKIGVGLLQRSFFQSRDENENFSDSISHIETRPRISDTQSQASRPGREKNLLQSMASRRDRDLLSSPSGFETRTRISLI